MSRFLILFLFLIWMVWRSDFGSPAPAGAADVAVFLGFFAVIVLTLGVWSRLLARRVSWRNLHRSLKYFNRTIFFARLAIPLWFAVGVFFMGWGPLVQKLMTPFNNSPVQLPHALLGTLPAILCWMGLWWSQFPADRALREQSILAEFDESLPIHSPPGFWLYCLSNLRLQVLFTAVPIMLILFLHDAAMVALWRAGKVNEVGSATEGLVTFLATASVFFFAPVILRYVLHTQSLGHSPLRERLEGLCRIHRLKYRDILLWRTENNMGNAAVMGIAPPVRYILLSDLLLERMTDEQIEAVFAHEVGHIVHRHMIWYLVFVKILVLALAATAILVEAQTRRLHLPSWLPLDLLMTLIGFGGFLIAFGFVSRRFERQADVFAARTLEQQGSAALESESQTLSIPAPREATFVGVYGASIFASALHRVAVINNIPVRARSWCHGSIATRMKYLQDLSEDPARTRRFDRFMSKLYVALLAALVISGIGAWFMNSAPW